MVTIRKGSKRVAALMLVILLLTSCMAKPVQEQTVPIYSKYSDSFFDTFDTLTQVVAYTENEEQFQQYFQRIHDRFQELHKLYDIYNNYEGLNNIKTINDQAGIQPVRVDPDIIHLIQFSKAWYAKVGETNIAMGSVLQIWHDYREAGMDDPEHAQLPPMEDLQKAAEHMSLDRVIVDTAKSTVYLEDPKMSLNVGAVAKGYATELVAKEMEAEGLQSALISAGGNIRAIGQPLDGVRKRWGVGLQNPDKFIATDDGNLLDTIFVKDASVVSSGDYQRYYMVDGQPVHHLIDPNTLMPGQYYRAVTVVTQDSGLADFLSTVVFLIPFDESRALVERLDGVEALWVMPDGSVEASEGMQHIMKSYGATGAKAS
ncbi:thiamine biosynthesis protein ApbE [Paenibacillus selenitireducens]|uniref:FAD:protein FMN transferase n=1 Tax=Paenibacillus selenitireducens TaxID=1324314 RepID=A0A1T2X328_9BACL|nr:FAD:protein FMN transferase [Paenibacillus selenitireducens]OPA74247.1 thiamine biosynthesis protein ApbE [Paenibacillus selenitireducens]